MMTEPALRKATYEDLLQVPEHLVAQIVNGRLITHPRPAPRRADTASLLGGDLVNPFRALWWILDGPELHLSDDVLVPDLAGWRRSRLPSLPKTAWFELAPDWVCEVLSPSTARTDRVEKLPLYAKAGVAHAWLVDPDLRTLEVYENHHGKWLLLGAFENDNRVRIAPFEAIEIELACLWAD